MPETIPPIPGGAPKRVTKRLRFEVLNRDKFACRYCGAMGEGVRLTIDHVVPQALGGTNTPDNLVTACSDCNLGKASSHPDATLVANVSDDAIAFGRALELAAQERRAMRDIGRENLRDAWQQWQRGGKSLPMPTGWETTADMFYEAGLDSDDVREAVRVAMTYNKVKDDDHRWRLMCRVAWDEVTARQNAARSLTASAAPVVDDFEQALYELGDNLRLYGVVTGDLADCLATLPEPWQQMVSVGHHDCPSDPLVLGNATSNDDLDLWGALETTYGAPVTWLTGVA